MEYLKPWVTELARINVSDQFDMDLFASEVLALHMAT